MRLGLLLDRFGVAGGGAEAHTHVLALRALRCGDEVVCASLDGSAPDGCAALRIPTPRRRPARDRAFASRGVRALRAEGCDVVLGVRHCPGVDVYLPHGGAVLDGYAAQDAARGGAGTWRRLRRALSGKVRYFLEAERELLGARDGPAVVCVSHAVAQRLCFLHPEAAGRCVVVHNGVDTTRFDRSDHAQAGARLRGDLGLEGAYVGLVVAHHPRAKGAATALRALAHPRLGALRMPVHLLVAGGPLELDLRRLARDLGVAERVHEVGLWSDPRPLYAAADVLVHPTFHDPCSLACLEALSMELPVVTTPQNGVAELMGARGGIVLEDPGDADALASALGVLEDPALRRQTGEDGRRIVQAHPQARALDAVLDVCRRAR